MAIPPINTTSSADPYQQTIAETCLALKGASIPVVFANGINDHFIGVEKRFTASAANYESACQTGFNAALAIQKMRKGVTPLLWNKDHVEAIKKYKSEHTLEIAFVAPYTKPEPRVSLMNIKHRIYIPMQLRANDSPQSIELYLKHEEGHSRDEQILLKAVPANYRAIVESILKNGTMTNQVEVSHLFNTYIKVFADKASNKAAYIQAASNFAKNVSQSGIRSDALMSIFSELLRYGEQTQNPDYKAQELQRGPSYDMQHPTPQNYWWRVLTAAYYQLLGVWPKMMSHPSMNPAAVHDVKPEDLAFFKDSITAAQKYF